VDSVDGEAENQENQEPEEAEAGAGGEAGAGTGAEGVKAGAAIATFAPRLLFRMDTLLDILRRLFPNGPAEFISIFSV
jgi:hypothetical protein